MAEKKFVLYDKSGKKYETTDRAEATSLKYGHGYTDQPPKDTQKDAADAPQKGKGGRK